MKFHLDPLESRRLLAVTWDVQADTWVATDGLGRQTPTSIEVGAPNAAKQVGMFYFLWTGNQTTTVYDNTDNLAANPTNPPYGPVNAFHYWDQPALGYYRTIDKAVVKKHLQLLADAGVDFLACDMTNNLIYQNSLNVLMQSIKEMQDAGMKVPKWCALASASSMSQLWTNVYSQNLYRDTWYEFDGKPLIMSKQDDAVPATYTDAAWTKRKSWATWSGSWFGTGQDAWPWTQFKSEFGWHDSSTIPEEMSISVASHPTNNIGRSYQTGTVADANQEPTKGIRFTDQVNTVLAKSPEVAFFTGWNEWIAQRFQATSSQAFAGKTIVAGDTYFVDQYNAEYSRDIEPSNGVTQDHYYYQLVDSIRKFKGATAITPTAASSVDIDGNFADWSSVGPEFRDTIGDPVNRNDAGLNDGPVTDSGGPFVNTTGRNDVVAAKVSYDAATVNFYVRTQANLTASTGANWMMLYVDTDQNVNTGWMGYDIAINRSRSVAGFADVQINTGGYNWTTIGRAPLAFNGNQMELKVTRAALGLTAAAAGVDFKWADNTQQLGTWQDFYTNGDTGPNDRFNYRANFAATPATLAGLVSTDVGSSGFTGTTAREAGESLTLSAIGNDIYGTSDQFRFASKALNGDGTIIAHVAQMDRTADASKAGIMFRESTSSVSRYVLLTTQGFTTPSLQQRATNSGSATTVVAGATNKSFNPVWLKLTRVGNVFTASTKTNVGDAWVDLGSTTLALNSSLQIGLAVTSRNLLVRTQARFDGISITQASAPVLPAVVNFVYDNETRQEAVFTFNNDVAATLDSTDVVVTNVTTGVDVGTFAYSFRETAAGVPTTARIRFAINLPDAVYRIRLVAGAVTDSNGNTNAAAIDQTFNVLGGDATGDGTVDTRDFATIIANFGKASRTFSQGNFNNDALVDSVDFGVLTARYGKTQTAPATLPAAAQAASWIRLFIDEDDEQTSLI